MSNEEIRSTAAIVPVSKWDVCKVLCSGSGSQLAIVLDVKQDGRLRMIKWKRASKEWTQPALYSPSEVLEKLDLHKPQRTSWERSALSRLPNALIERFSGLVQLRIHGCIPDSFLRSQQRSEE